MQLKSNTELQGGKYRIIRVLGQGGFGITYLAEHTMLDKMVAIKEFFPKEYCDRDETTSHITIGTKNSVDLVAQLKSKFVKEAKNISKLHHANIITIHDIFEENDTEYYAMEYVEGVSLAELVKNGGALDEAVAIGYIRKVADAVGYMHSLSMNHLDLKPANIMVRKADNEPVLIDFGLSKQYDASGGQTSTTPVGISHGFAPIEQYRPGGVSTFTPQTDIYSLGATLYNLLSGVQPPHYSELLEAGMPEFPVTVSAKVVRAVEHAMEVRKNKRPSSMMEFLHELESDSKVIYNEERTSLETGMEISSEKTYIEINQPTTADVGKFATYKPDKTKDDAIEDTMVIENVNPLENSGVSGKSVIIDDIEFVDLGLSVKWANKNIGANGSEDAGIFFNKNMDGNLAELYQWNTKGAKVPTSKEFMELISLCRWIWYDNGSSRGYQIWGPNGNSINMAVTGDETEYPVCNLVTFGKLWTKEALLNEWRTQGELLYFNHTSVYVSDYFIKNIRCPIRLILKK